MDQGNSNSAVVSPTCVLSMHPQYQVFLSANDSRLSRGNDSSNQKRLLPVRTSRTLIAETRRRWDIFQAEVTLYWELAVRRCSHPSLNFAQHSRVYTFQGGGIHRGGDNLNKACKCSTGISHYQNFPSPDLISITVSFKCIGANPISLTVLPIPSHYHRDKGTFNLGPCTMVRKCIKTKG